MSGTGCTWPPGSRALRAILLALAIGQSCWRLAHAKSPQGEPLLHARIDALIEAHGFLPTAGICSDAEFLRRASLDAAGVPPTSAEARGFLASTEPSKRAVLIDALLSSPQYARNMQRAFDVMLMERRPDKHVTAAEWQEYLRASFDNNKPIDQLFREILAADGEGPLRPAAKFYLDRDADPDLLTRDVGRLVFGRDLQCAQCHDHPLVDEYTQAEYYGLRAFFNRTAVQSNVQGRVVLSETGAGELAFKSVFTGEARTDVLPRVPGGIPVPEPVLLAGQEYFPKSAANADQRPRFSRRAQLADTANLASTQAFRRNVVNRVWAMFFGPGLIDPPDLNHADNPPIDPELLDLLATEFAASNFNLRELIREVMLTRAYQRSSVAPELSGSMIDEVRLARLLSESRAGLDRVSAALIAARNSAEPTTAAVVAALADLNRAAADRLQAEQQSEQAKATAISAAKSVTDLERESRIRADLFQALTDAYLKSRAAAEISPGDRELTQSSAWLDFQREHLAGFVSAIQTRLNDARVEAQIDAARQSSAERRADAERIRWSGVRWQFESVATQADAAARSVYRLQAELRALQVHAADLSATIELCRSSSVPERLAAELVARSQRRFLIASLKPLPPEMLAASIMRATGAVNAIERAASVELESEMASRTAEEHHTQPQQTAQLLERKLHDRLRPQVNAFVQAFGRGPGQADYGFQPTVQQALFVANGQLIDGWIKPADGNLVARLMELDDPAALSAELYLSVLTRSPTLEETAEVAAALASGGASRESAVRELVWALLSCAEFRFNH